MEVPFFRASITDEEIKAAECVLKSGWLTSGAETQAFEREFAAKVASPFALAVNSNTSGMLLAMEALGVKKGKAVITTPYTFVSTAACALHLGADVLFADIEKDSYSIDPQKVEAILESPQGKNVVAIVPVHIAGNVCNMDLICAIAKKYGVKVIEDCAHSFPSETDLGFAGTIGDAGVFSFYATKTITCGEGGMVCVKDKDVAERIRLMRLHGMSRDAWKRYTAAAASFLYDVEELGFKSNLPDILSAVARVQLGRTDELFQKRKVHARKYDEAFSKLDFVKPPPTGKGDARHLYLLRLELSRLSCSRDYFAKELQRRGVGISVHFIPLFHFSYWKRIMPNFTAQMFPEAEAKFLQTISLPLWPDMTSEMTDYVIDCVREIGETNRA